MRYTIILTGDTSLTRDQLHDTLLQLERQVSEHGPVEEAKLILPGQSGFNPDTSTPTTIRVERERRARAGAPYIPPAPVQESSMVEVAEKLPRAPKKSKK